MKVREITGAWRWAARNEALDLDWDTWAALPDRVRAIIQAVALDELVTLVDVYPEPVTFRVYHVEVVPGHLTAEVQRVYPPPDGEGV